MPKQPPEILLERLGFERKRQFQKVESLSGGERRRLHLAAVLASCPNVLILDEPTNDLSLEVVEVLEEMLQVGGGLGGLGGGSWWDGMGRARVLRSYWAGRGLWL